ncbi:MAG: FAD-dependent thymidylate synthase [bacterium]|nr:FAD-dependent thymidylate synthase [bacterium]MDW8087441.1 FAD-dependent thymidylate synthase [Candidatus Calescibacterium sp.]
MWGYCGTCVSFNVLDKGFVSLIDFCGGDQMVVRAARISYGKESKGAEQDRKLINYMMKHKHGTPFEHSLFVFHVKAPIFVARQWFRHRIGSFNEISGRYVEYQEEFYIPKSLRAPDTKNKQGSVQAEFSNEQELIRLFADSISSSFRVYKTLVDSGVAREIARAVLPLSLYTQFYWSVNPRSLMNFISLRTSEDAQYEIREYAERITFFVKDKMPWTFSAFIEFGFEDGKNKFIDSLKSQINKKS